MYPALAPYPKQIDPKIGKAATQVTRALIEAHVVGHLPVRVMYNADLAGACAIGAWHLAQKIPDSRFVFGAIKDHAKIKHCWVEWDNWIIDPTSSQFSFKTPLFKQKDKTNIYIPSLYDNKAEKMVKGWIANPFDFTLDTRLDLSASGRAKYTT